MRRVIQRAAMGILGMAIMFAYWSFTGGVKAYQASGIPSKIGEGGGGLLSIEVESTAPARFSIDFGDDGKTEEYWVPVDGGSHIWTVDIPRGAGGHIELDAENPKVGDRLSWKLRLDGAVVNAQSETLDQPLKSGYAFFLETYSDDYSRMKLAEGEAE